MTLETLQADIEYEDCSDALVLMQKEVELKESKLKLRNAQMDFVAAMQRRKGSVLLQVPPPKPPTGVVEINAADDSCSACGVLMYDPNALGVFMLPCKHAYHIYCFAHLAGKEESCMAP